MNTTITNITSLYNSTGLNSFNLGHILAVDLSSVLFGIGLLFVALLVGYAYTRKLTITLVGTLLLSFGLMFVYKSSALWLGVVAALVSFTILTFAYEIFTRGR